MGPVRCAQRSVLPPQSFPKAASQERPDFGREKHFAVRSGAFLELSPAPSRPGRAHPAATWGVPQQGPRCAAGSCERARLQRGCCLNAFSLHCLLPVIYTCCHVLFSPKCSLREGAGQSIPSSGAHQGFAGEGSGTTLQSDPVAPRLFPG